MMLPFNVFIRWSFFNPLGIFFKNLFGTGSFGLWITDYDLRFTPY